MVLEDHGLVMGHVVVGPAAGLDTAVSLAGSEAIRFAMLDADLGDVGSFPVAEVPTTRVIAFVFATGRGRGGIADSHRDAVFLGKPCDLPPLVRRVAGEAPSGSASP